jgi:hypothetical protein
MGPSRFCAQCGRPTEGSERYCTSCGAALVAAAEPAQAGAPLAADAGEGAASSAAAATAVRTDEQGAANFAPAADPVPPGVGQSSPGGPGDPPRPGPAASTSRPPWLAIALSALIVVVVGAIASAVLISAGGTPPSHAARPAVQTVRVTDTILASRGLYAATQQPAYSALLPAGWQPISATLPEASAVTTVRSPVDAGAAISVGQIAQPAKTLRQQAQRILALVASTPGFAQQQSAAVTLAGGRPSWEIAYTAGTLSYAYYIVRSCGRSYAISAAVSLSRVSVLRPRVQIVAATLQGNC